MSTRPHAVGRYVVYDEIAAGGMASVHIGRLQGPVGFARTVAIKRLHAQYAKDPEFVAMFLDEARLAARIHHPNVVATVDVIALGGELFLVMDYVQGETLSRLMRALRDRRMRLPPHIALGIVADALYGLHAAHEATSERGEPLSIVHRDVSPQNIIVGKDGVARVLDFGVAKAASRVQTTRDGHVKGKLGYMAPEQLTLRSSDRRTDIFAASVVLWESLTGVRLFEANEPGGTIARVLLDRVAPPSSIAADLPPTLDDIVLKGLAREPDARFATAHEMATALEGVLKIARPAEVGAYVERIAGDVLADRARRIAEIEGSPSVEVPVAQPQRVGPTEASRTMRLATEDPISEVAPMARAPTMATAGTPRRARLTAVALLGIGAIASGAWLAKRPAPRHSTEAARAEAAPPALPSASVVVAPAPPPPPLTSAALEQPSASAEIVATAHPPETHVHVKPLQRKPKTASKSCDPPFYFDEAGLKRFKPECL